MRPIPTEALSLVMLVFFQHTAKTVETEIQEEGLEHLALVE